VFAAVALKRLALNRISRFRSGKVSDRKRAAVLSGMWLELP
jgi:hypothetical protein